MGTWSSPTGTRLHPLPDLLTQRYFPESYRSWVRILTSPFSFFQASPSVSPSSSTVVSPKGHGGLASPPATTPTSSVNGTALPPGSPVGSPLNKLQSMQPFDYRKSSEAKTPDSISSRGSIERPIPPSLPHGMPRMPGAGMGMGMPLIPNVSVPPSLASYHNSITKVTLKTPRNNFAIFFHSDIFFRLSKSTKCQKSPMRIRTAL